MTKDNSHSHAWQLNDVTPENILAEVQGAESGSYKAEAVTIGMKENLHMLKEVGEGGMLKEINNMFYEELLEKVVNYEAELKFAKKKLESSQEEITKLKYENLTLVEELRTSEENMERMEHMLRSTFQEQHQLNLANQSIELLQEELASQRRLVSELQQAITKTTNHLTDHCRETDELKLTLHDAQQGFSNDRAQFQSEITHLRKENDALDTMLKEAELRNKLLEEQIQKYEVERVETRNLHKIQETGLLDEIKQKCEVLDFLNKSLDASKLKYDMLMAERDESFAKVQTLKAEVECRDVHIQQMVERVSELSVAWREFLAESDKAQKEAEELRQKVREQEKELEKQRAVICDRDEEKREAIRQLCVSLEHYRNGYHELRLAFIKHNSSAVLPS